MYSLNKRCLYRVELWSCNEAGITLSAHWETFALHDDAWLNLFVANGTVITDAIYGEITTRRDKSFRRHLMLSYKNNKSEANVSVVRWIRHKPRRRWLHGWMNTGEIKSNAPCKLWQSQGTYNMSRQESSHVLEGHVWSDSSLSAWLTGCEHGHASISNC